MVRVAFATCVQLGLSCMEEIYNVGGSLELLITLLDSQSPNKSGRVYLDDFAGAHGIPLLKSRNINDDEVITQLKESRIDWLFIIGWSQIARETLLSTPKLGCIGMHPTLLPIGRGRAAIPWAILKGLDRTGVTMFKLDEGVDTGPVIGQEVIPIGPKETATTLYDKVNRAHVSLISRYWLPIVRNEITLTPQNDSEATQWPGREPEDGEIFGDMTMAEAERLVRAVTKPYPGGFYREKDRILRIWSAEATDCIDEKDSGLAIELRDGYLIPIDFELEQME